MIIEQEYQRVARLKRQNRNRKLLGLFAGTLFLALLGIAGNEDLRQPVEPIRATAVIKPLTEQEKKIANILYSEGSRHSVPLAKAIAQTKRPRLVTAVVLQESRGDITAVGLAGELGCGQVMQEHWGPVPKDAAGQVKQVEQILEELLASSQGKIKIALNKYNGDHSGRYARQVVERIAMVKL